MANIKPSLTLKNLNSKMIKKSRQQLCIEYNRKYLDRLKQSNLELFGNKCQICNSIEKLEFHHKIACLQGSSRGSYKRYNAVRKNPERFILICSECHKKITKNKNQY